MTCQYPTNKPMTGYQYGCRCDRCAGAHNDYHRDYQRDHPKPPRSPKYGPPKPPCLPKLPRSPQPSGTLGDVPRRPPARRRGYGSTWEKIRLVILQRDGYRCVQCGSTDNMQVDHILPLSKGGTHHPDNLRALCRRCNLARRDMPPTWAQRGKRKVPANKPARQGYGGVVYPVGSMMPINNSKGTPPYPLSIIDGDDNTINDKDNCNSLMSTLPPDQAPGITGPPRNSEYPISISPDMPGDYQVMHGRYR
jgi:5-methylcytosine-specific restriction endonuclease McrA